MDEFVLHLEGEEIDEVLRKVANGEYVERTELDEYVTEAELEGKGYAVARNVANALATKVTAVKGKDLSTEDFTTELKDKLEALSNYDDSEIAEAVEKLRNDIDTLVGGDTTKAIESLNEIISFLKGIEDSQSLDSIIASIEAQIASKQDTITDLSTIREGASKGATAVQGVYINSVYNGRKDGKGNIDLGKVVSTISVNGEVLSPDESGNVDIGVIESSGGGEDNVYVLPFTYEELTECATNNSALTISQDLIDAISANKVIVIKTSQLTVTGNLNGAYISSATSIARETRGGYKINISLLYSVDLIMRFTLTSRNNTLVVDVSKSVNKVATINGQSLADTDNIAVISKMNVNGKEITPDANGVADLGEIGGGDMSDYATLEMLEPRNIGTVDTTSEVDDVVGLATTEYVDTAIATAITTTLNTPV